MAERGGPVILGEVAKAEMARVGKELGIICTACAGEMSGPGFEFISMRVEDRRGQPTVVVGKRFICGRDCCAEAREKAHSEATAVRDAGGWTTLDDTPDEEASANGNGSGD